MPPLTDTYFHASERRLRPGLVCKARKSGIASSPRTAPGQLAERLLESARPDGMLPRHRSVFMIDSTSPLEFMRAGAALGHAYQVQPIGEIETNHMGWWSLIAANHGNGVVIDAHGLDWASNYWHGEDCPDELCLAHGAIPGTWERRSSSFSVVSEEPFSAQMDGVRITVSNNRFFIYVAPDSPMLDAIRRAGFGRVTLANSPDKTQTFFAEADRATLLRLEAALGESAPAEVLATPMR